MSTEYFTVRIPHRDPELVEGSWPESSMADLIGRRQPPRTLKTRHDAMTGLGSHKTSVPSQVIISQVAVIPRADDCYRPEESALATPTSRFLARARNDGHLEDEVRRAIGSRLWEVPALRGLPLDGQLDDKLGARRGVRFHANGPIVFRNDAAHDGEAEARAALFRRKIRQEELVEGVGPNARTAVRDRHRDHFAMGIEAGAHPNLLSRGFLECFRSVVNQVDDCALHLFG